MKNLIVIFFLSLLYISDIQSQNYSAEHRVSTVEYLSFSIDFFHDDTYIFSCMKHQINSDVLDIHLLSFGNFEETKEFYILRDEFNDYQLRLQKVKIEKERDKTFLKTIDGFDWMKKSLFILSDNEPSDTSFLIENISFPKKKKNIDYNCQQSQEFISFSGTYKSHGLKYKIVLEADKSYGIYLYDFLLSSGKWKEKENVLILTDTSLKKDFLALISTEGVIISRYLPFEFRGRHFSKDG